MILFQDMFEAYQYMISGKSKLKLREKEFSPISLALYVTSMLSYGAQGVSDIIQSLK